MSSATTAAVKAPVIVTNGTKGLQVHNSSFPIRVVHQLTDRSVRCMEVSADGKFLVYPATSASGESIRVLNLESGEQALELPVTGSPQFLKLSPKGTWLASWFPFKSAKPGEEEVPNLTMHELATGAIRGSIVCKKMSKWEPEWTADESVCARLHNTELLFYDNIQKSADSTFDRWTQKMETQKTQNFALATNSRNGQTYVACYSGPGSKGQASFVRIYRFPSLGNAIANKSFFKADNVTFMWSPRGDCLLFLCTSDVDKSGKSYYGEQKLNFMDATAGSSNSSYNVPLKKEGPIHAVSWLPDVTQSPTYCVVYGYIPARVSLFDVKGNIVFDFNGTEMKVNQIVFNPFGNVVALAGFGNLRGGVHVWDLEKRKQVAEFQCPETTDIAWSPDGLSILTATTAPRLRVGNGFKLWTATGKPVLDNTFPTNVELYRICWQPRPGVYSKPKLTSDFKPQAVAAQAAATRYVPPSKRSQAEQERVKMEEIKKTDPVKEKKMQALTRKLTEISKLKQKQSLGAELKQQQMDILPQENTIRRELEQLKL